MAKDTYIQVRVTHAAKAEMVAKAEREGVSLSELFRRAVLEQAEGAAEEAVRDPAHFDPPVKPKPSFKPEDIPGVTKGMPVLDQPPGFVGDVVRYTCPNGCDPAWLPTSQIRCPSCMKLTVPVLSDT